MKDYASIPNTDGAFPSVESRNVTTPGAGDGTPITKNVLDDVWGFFQAILSEAGDTPSDDSETYDASQLLDGIRAICVDGLVGGTYSPSSGLTWNNQMTVDASSATGTNLTAFTAVGKGHDPGISATGGTDSGEGGAFYGGANTTDAGMGLVCYGGEPTSSGSASSGGTSFGGNAVVTGSGGMGFRGCGGDGAGAAGAGGVGLYGSGGVGAGTGNGGLGLRGIGGEANGPGAALIGYGSTLTETYANQGAIIKGGSGGADALWAITATGAEPSGAKSDYAIWASTGGAFPATAVSGRSDLGYGLIGISAAGIGCSVTATSTGSPFRIVPKSATPTTNLASGCFYVDSDDATIRHYEGSDWYIVPDAKATAVGGGSGSAGAGNQYIELRFGAATYKILHDGTV